MVKTKIISFVLICVAMITFLSICVFNSMSIDVKAADSTVTFTIRNWGELTNTSYVSDETEGSGLTSDENNIDAVAKNFTPYTGQIRGNRTSVGDNFYLFNTDELPGYIVGITISGQTDDTNYFQNNMYAVVGYDSQGDIIDVREGVKGSASADGFSWSFDSSDCYTYFKLYSNEKFTTGAVKNVVITVTCASKITSRILNGIYISGNASKLEYNEGETFDPQGLKVMGKYDDELGDSEITTNLNWTFSPNQLTTETTSVDVTVSTGGFTSDAKTINNLVVSKAIKVEDILPAELLNDSKKTWNNDNGYGIAYVYDGNLYFQDKNNLTSIISDFSLSTPLTKNGNYYTATSGGRTFTFTMSSDVLTEITVTGGSGDYLYGTYTEPALVVGDTFIDSTTGLKFRIKEFATYNYVTVINDESYASLTEVTVPEEVKYKDVTYRIADVDTDAFAECKSLVSVNLPANISIGPRAFRNCSNLKNVTLPSYLDKLSANVFENCISLEEVTIPYTVNKIANAAFKGCSSLKTVYLNGKEPAEFGAFVFDKCTSLKNIVTPLAALGDYKAASGWSDYSDILVQKAPSVKDIFFLDGNFENPSTKSKTPDHISFQVININPLEVSILNISCSNISNFVMPSTVSDGVNTYNVTAADGYSFSSLVADSLTLSEGMKVLNDGTFAWGSIKKVILPSSVTTIPNTCFQGCFLLEELVINGNITSIGNYAFSSCTALKTITLNSTTVPTLGDFAFEIASSLDTIFVPESVVLDYKSADGWRDIADKIIGVHVHAIKVTHEKVENKCEEAGHEAYYECNCGKYFSDEALSNEITNLQTWLGENGEGYLAPINHNWSEISYSWNGDNCTATRTCLNDEKHIETETVTGVFVEETPATCLDAATGHYVATFTNPIFISQSSETVSKGEALNHNWGEVTYSWDGSKCTATRTCLNDNNHTETETATGVYVKDSDSSKKDNEKGHYEVVFANSNFTTQTTPTNSIEKPDTMITGLSLGGIIGISLGSLLLLLLIAYIVMFIYWKKKDKAFKFLIPSYKWINKTFFKE